MCNNNGHCRKFDAGTMCPSYRVTRDEQHLTRGRANTLRLALSGQLGEDGLASDAVREAMELCVSCKGCKRDCPTGVDMARMKIEFLHADRRKNGWSLKDKLVARLPDYVAAAGRFAAVLNLRNRSPWLARVGESLTGCPNSAPTTSSPARAPARHARQFSAPPDRSCCSWTPSTASSNRPTRRPRCGCWRRRATRSTSPPRRKPTASTCAAAAPTWPRAWWTKPRPRRARSSRRSRPSWTGLPIVGLEPSCLLTLRDEFTAMGLGEAATALARRSFLLEEFLAQEDAAGRLDALRAKLRPMSQPLLVHGHCHQKAFDAVSPVLQVLKLIPGAQPRLIESSCCGMAGSFGYEAKHHAISMRMAEANLLPAVRQAPEAVVVADGTSCRHQIADGAQREAVHAAVLLARQLP